VKIGVMAINEARIATFGAAAISGISYLKSYPMALLLSSGASASKAYGAIYAL